MRGTRGASDLTPELFESGRRHAASRGLTLEWREADCEALPFGDDAFDPVISCLGVMFAPFHQKIATELVRVTRPGGTIGLLNWTPTGFIGQMFTTMKPDAPPPPPGARPPPLWGDEVHVRGLLGDRVVARVRVVFLGRGEQEHRVVHRDCEDPKEAMVGSLAHSGRVIFAAGAVMVAVFFTFALSGPLPPKEMGIVLGVAVLLDAFLVRLMLLPVMLRRTGKQPGGHPPGCGACCRRSRSPTAERRPPDAHGSHPSLYSRHLVRLTTT